VNIDDSHVPDGIQNIADLRSVGHVMIEMLTRTQPSEAEVLRLPFSITDMSEESYTHCQSFLAIASKQAADLKTYREHLDLLQRQLATWKIQTTGEKQIEQLLKLSALPEASMCSRRPR
jgi:hypothetical protein